MSNIILSSKNITNKQTNSTLSYKFPRDVRFELGSEIVLSHMNIYYSWFNITSKNNFFQYIWFNNTNGALDVVVDVYIEPGYYDVKNLYEYIISVMVRNGHYLVLKSSGNFVYFLEILTNAVYYAVEVKLSSLSSGNMTMEGVTDLATNLFHTPTGWVFPLHPQCPQIIIPSNNLFGELIGFSPGTIAVPVVDQTVNKSYSLLNNFVPNMEPQPSFTVSCNLVKNELSSPSDILASFSTAGVNFGSMVSSSMDIVWSNIAPGTYSEVTLRIWDQDHNPMTILDPSMLFVLSIRQPNK